MLEKMLLPSGAVCWDYTVVALLYIWFQTSPSRMHKICAMVKYISVDAFDSLKLSVILDWVSKTIPAKFTSGLAAFGGSI